jgi:hypothetical protein
MPAHFHVVHRIATLAFVLGDLYLLGLWFYAIARTGLLFFWILAGAGIVFLVLAVINVALAYDLQGIQKLLGSQFVPLYEIFLAVQPLNLLLGAIGHTMLVRWIVRSHVRATSPA